MYYRQRILGRIICALKNGQPFENVIDLRKAIATIAKVGKNDVKAATIRNCFVKCGFFFSTEPDLDEGSDVGSALNIEMLEHIAIKGRD